MDSWGNDWPYIHISEEQLQCPEWYIIVRLKLSALDHASDADFGLQAPLTSMRKLKRMVGPGNPVIGLIICQYSNCSSTACLNGLSGGLYRAHVFGGYFHAWA